MPVKMIRPMKQVTAAGKLQYSFHRGQIRALRSNARYTLVLAGNQSGKALALDTPIPTPSGFRPMADLAVGDSVFDEAGQVCRVVGVSEVAHDRECFQLTFDDGSAVVADAEHLWVTETAQLRRAQARRVQHGRGWPLPSIPPAATITTKEIAASLRNRRGVTNHSVVLAAPFETPEADLPIPPYTLGVWLGDGTSSCSQVTTADEEVVAAIRLEGVSVGPGVSHDSGKARAYRLDSGRRGGDRSVRQWTMHARLRALGLLKNKHIPTAYLFASKSQRLALLRGLMDSDGYASHQCEFVNTNRRLAEDMLVLLRGLGIKPRVARKIPTLRGKHCSEAWRITFNAKERVFVLPRKRERQNKPVRPDVFRRFIVSCEPTDSVPVKCIAVDSPSRQYLCTESFIPTHNSSIGPPWCYQQAQRQGMGDGLVVAPTFKLLDKKVVPEFQYLFEQRAKLGTYSSQKHKFTFNDRGCHLLWGQVPDQPCFVHFGHADEPESIESMTAKWAWLDEAGQRRFRLRSWETIQERLGVHEGPALLTTKPYGPGWLKSRLYDPWAKAKRAGQRHPYIDVIRFTSLMNPAFSREEWDRARAELPAWKFDLHYRAIFSRPAGLIYDCFDEETMTCLPFAIPMTWPRYCGLDFGGVNTAAVKIARDPETGKLYLYAEYGPVGGRTATEHGDYLLKGEPKPPMAVGGSKSEGQWRKEFKGKLSVMEPPISDVEVGIQRVYSLFKQGKLTVFKDCLHVIDELSSYSRKVDEAGEPTEDIEDKETYHLLDALRYIGTRLGQPGAAWDFTPPVEPNSEVAKAPKGMWLT